MSMDLASRFDRVWALSLLAGPDRIRSCRYLTRGANVEVYDGPREESPKKHLLRGC